MYIKYCTDEFLEEFKANFEAYIPMYINNDIEKISEVFNSQNIKEGNFQFEYKEIKTSKTSSNPERDNIRNVYETLKDLTPVQASQEKLWVPMYNTYYIHHLFDYININKDKKNFESGLKGSVIFTQGNNRSLIVQNLSRMWWLGYYLYDEDNKKNPYELLDFYTDSGDIVGKSTVFFGSNLTSNKNLRHGILDGIKELVELNIIKNERKYYTNINKYFNIVGGIKILDFMSREKIKNETMEYIIDSSDNEEIAAETASTSY